MYIFWILRILNFGIFEIKNRISIFVVIIFCCLSRTATRKKKILIFILRRNFDIRQIYLSLEIIQRATISSIILFRIFAPFTKSVFDIFLFVIKYLLHFSLYIIRYTRFFSILDSLFCIVSFLQIVTDRHLHQNFLFNETKLCISFPIKFSTS